MTRNGVKIMKANIYLLQSFRNNTEGDILLMTLETPDVLSTKKIVKKWTDY
jgi:hypothetical protein